MAEERPGRRGLYLQKSGDVIERAVFIISPDHDLALPLGKVRDRIRQRFEDLFRRQLVVPISRRIDASCRIAVIGRVLVADLAPLPYPSMTSVRVDGGA